MRQAVSEGENSSIFQGCGKRVMAKNTKWYVHVISRQKPVDRENLQSHYSLRRCFGIEVVFASLSLSMLLQACSKVVPRVRRHGARRWGTTEYLDAPGFFVIANKPYGLRRRNAIARSSNQHSRVMARKMHYPSQVHRSEENDGANQAARARSSPPSSTSASKRTQDTSLHGRNPPPARLAPLQCIVQILAR